MLSFRKWNWNILHFSFVWAQELFRKLSVFWSDAVLNYSSTDRTFLPMVVYQYLLWTVFSLHIGEVKLFRTPPKMLDVLKEFFQRFTIGSCKVSSSSSSICGVSPEGMKLNLQLKLFFNFNDIKTAGPEFRRLPNLPPGNENAVAIITHGQFHLTK